MRKLPYKYDVSVAAHAGYTAKFAENTREAFIAAAESHCDMIETDIHISKDGVLVLIHDDTVDATTDGSGRIADMTYAELCKLNCNPNGAFSQIVTLNEFMELAVKHDMMVNLEIKEYNVDGNGDRSRLCVEKALALVEKFNWVEKTVINSFDASVLEYTNEISGGKYLLHGFYPYDMMFNVKQNPDEYLYCACIFDDRNVENYKYLQEKGIEPWAGAGVVAKEHFDSCVSMGAVLFTSNDPTEAMEILSDLGHRK